MSQEGQYIFNSLGFYIGGVLVAFMAAGFCMLDSTAPIPVFPAETTKRTSAYFDLSKLSQYLQNEV